MNQEQRLFFITFILIPLAGILLFCVGCSTNTFPSRNTNEDRVRSASHYLAMAETAESPLSLEYRLRAAENYLRASQDIKAVNVLRDIQAKEPGLDPELRASILQSRLAIVKEEHKAALSYVSAMLASVAKLNQSNPNNPAYLTNTSSNKKFALLLPSKGPHAEAAKTIREGFLAAYYKASGNSSNRPSVQVYDTGEGSEVFAAYQKALADNVDMIVGPLTKPEVQTISKTSLKIPVLALNTLTGNSSHPSSLYQFGLLPEDEVEAVAQHAKKQGRQKALILAPKTDWGQRMVAAFKKAWDGKVQGIVWLDPNEDLSTRIRSTIENIHSSKRNEIDMIFLAASAPLARQVKPLLNYHHAAQIPVYASAAVYSGTPAPGKDQDLEGVRFCDMPWILSNTTELRETRQKVAELWPNSFSRSPRYFALGLDAYKLATQLAESRFMPISGTLGVTGDLKIDNKHRILRKLSCAKFVQGVPVPD